MTTLKVSAAALDLIQKIKNGRKPPVRPSTDKVAIYRTEDTLWVSLPKDVDPAILRGIQGSNYVSSMRMYAVQSLYLYSLLAALYRDAKVRTEYWPPAIHPESLRPIAEEVTKKIAESEALRIGEILEDVPAYLEYNGTKPRPYQYTAAKYLATIGKAILALPLGAGKSITVITALKILREQPVPRFRGAVVICPSALKELVWRREVAKFSDFVPVVIDGTKAQRAIQYETPADVYILNPELLHRDHKEIKRIVEKASVLIVDEASILRNPTSTVSRMVRSLADDKHYFWPMTGTPLMNSIMELHTLVDMVERNIFRSRADFQRRYMPQAKDGSWLTRGVKNQEELVEKVSPIMFARTPLELRDELPSHTTVVEPIILGTKQRAMYDEIKTKMYIELSKYEDSPENEKFMIMNNVLTAMTRMKQLCNGEIVEDENPKMDRLLEMMETSLINDKVLVFTQYETTAIKVQKELIAAGYDAVLLSGMVKSKERAQAVDRYQKDPSCRVFVMTTAGGMGLNLTKTTAVLYYDMLWNPQMMHQIAGRALRIGNESPHVRIISLIAHGTIEETIVRRLQEKSSTFNAVMHAKEIKPDQTDGNTMFHDLLDMVKSQKKF